MPCFGILKFPMLRRFYNGQFCPEREDHCSRHSINTVVCTTSQLGTLTWMEWIQTPNVDTERAHTLIRYIVIFIRRHLSIRFWFCTGSSFFVFPLARVTHQHSRCHLSDSCKKLCKKWLIYIPAITYHKPTDMEKYAFCVLTFQCLSLIRIFFINMKLWLLRYRQL